MLLKEIKSIKSGRTELRKFGITVGIVFALLGIFLWWRGKNYCFYLLACSALLLILGLLIPLWLKPIHKVWMSIALVLGYVMTSIILYILFYLILTPISIISRLCGKDFLDIKIDKSQKSYWKYREQEEFSKERYEKQF